MAPNKINVDTVPVLHPSGNNLAAWHTGLHHTFANYSHNAGEPDTYQPATQTIHDDLMVRLDLDISRDQDPAAFSPAHPFVKERFLFLPHNFVNLPTYF